jgi:hypothetical protein
MLFKAFGTLFWLLLLCKGSGFCQAVYDTFDSPPRKMVLVSKSGIKDLKNLIVANPEKDVVNKSDSCLQYKRFAGIKYDYLKVNTGLLENILPYILEKKKVNLLIYSPAEGVVLELFFQNSEKAAGDYPKGRNSMFRASTQTENTWELLTFDFIFQPDAGTPTTSIDQLVLQVAPNSKNGDTYYLDNLKGPAPLK